MVLQHIYGHGSKGIEHQRHDSTLIMGLIIQPSLFWKQKGNNDTRTINLN